MTGLASASLQREVNRLAAAGLVIERRIGNVRQLQANRDSPLYPEISSLVQKTLGISSVLHAALLSLKGSVQFAALFGSTAKGLDHSASDIDVLVVSNQLSFTQLMTALLPAERTLLRKVNLTLLTESEFAARRAQADSFVNRVLSGQHEVLFDNHRASNTKSGNEEVVRHAQVQPARLKRSGKATHERRAR